MGARVGQEIALAPNRSPKDEAITAPRATGKWCSLSWKPSGNPTTSTGAPTSTPLPGGSIFPA